MKCDEKNEEDETVASLFECRMKVSAKTKMYARFFAGVEKILSTREKTRRDYVALDIYNTGGRGRERLVYRTVERVYV
jgi:hypothetical protein